MKRLAWAAVLAALPLLACPDTTTAPGVRLGAFRFQARWLEGAAECALTEIPEPEGGGVVFDFAGVFSEDPDAGTGYFTIDDVSRRGAFDGYRFESVVPEPGGEPIERTFEFDPGTGCPGNAFHVTETMRVVFLSPTQSAAFFDAETDVCLIDPRTLLADGVPVDPDAGIFAPTRNPEFDAANACGILIEQVVPAPCDGGTSAVSCLLTFRIDGVRQQ